MIDDKIVYRVTYKKCGEKGCFATSNLFCATEDEDVNTKFYEILPKDEYELLGVSRIYSKSELDDYIKRGMPFLNEAHVVKQDKNIIDKDDESNYNAYYYDRDFLVDPSSGHYCECEDCGWFGEKDELIRGKCPDCGSRDIVKESIEKDSDYVEYYFDFTIPGDSYSDYLAHVTVRCSKDMSLNDAKERALDYARGKYGYDNVREMHAVKSGYKNADIIDETGKLKTSLDTAVESVGDSKDNSKNVLDLVIEHFGVTDTPYNGPTFILPNGKFLDIKNYEYHSDVEKWLIDNGYSNNEFIKTAGSKTLYNLGCIRCDTIKYYISLPFNSQPTGEQYNSLLVWLDYLQRFHNAVEVITPDNQHIMYKFDEDTISDTVVDKIRAYYYSGVLREAKKFDTKHAHNFKYDRNKLGETIQKSTLEERTNFNMNQYSNRINEAHLYDINRTSSDYVNLMNERGLDGHMSLLDDSTIITNKGKLNIGLVSLDDLDDKSLIVIPAYDFQWIGTSDEAEEVYDLFLNEDNFDDIEGVIDSLIQMYDISEVRDFFSSINIVTPKLKSSNIVENESDQESDDDESEVVYKVFVDDSVDEEFDDYDDAQARYEELKQSVDEYTTVSIIAYYDDGSKDIIDSYCKYDDYCDYVYDSWKDA